MSEQEDYTRNLEEENEFLRKQLARRYFRTVDAEVQSNYAGVDCHHEGQSGNCGIACRVLGNGACEIADEIIEQYDTSVEELKDLYQIRTDKSE